MIRIFFAEETNTVLSAAGPVTLHPTPASPHSVRTHVRLPRGRRRFISGTAKKTGRLIFVTVTYNSTMKDFDRILSSCAEISDELPGAVYIGGVAVYLHAANSRRANMQPEVSHDADFMISLVDFGELREARELTANRRLGKYQMIFDEVEFDVYVERQNKLIVPYDEVFANADAYEGIKVACLEHLLVLKLEALADRKGSSKGDKDERDVVAIGIMAGREVRRFLVEPYVGDEQVGMLKKIMKGRVFTDLASGNAHLAKKIRKSFSSFVDVLV